MKITKKDLRKLIFEVLNLSPEDRHRLKYRKEKQLIGNLDAYNDESELIFDLVLWAKGYMNTNRYSAALDAMAPEDRRGIVFDPLQSAIAIIRDMLNYPGLFRQSEHADDESLQLISDRIMQTYGPRAGGASGLNTRQILSAVESKLRSGPIFNIRY